jgi:hypothetical protein
MDKLAPVVILHDIDDSLLSFRHSNLDLRCDTPVKRVFFSVLHREGQEGRLYENNTEPKVGGFDRVDFAILGRGAPVRPLVPTNNDR